MIILFLVQISLVNSQFGCDCSQYQSEIFCQLPCEWNSNDKICQQRTNCTNQTIGNCSAPHCFWDTDDKQCHLKTQCTQIKPNTNNLTTDYTYCFKRKCGLSIDDNYCKTPVESCDQIDNSAQCELEVEMNSQSDVNPFDVFPCRWTYDGSTRKYGCQRNTGCRTLKTYQECSSYSQCFWKITYSSALEISRACHDKPCSWFSENQCRRKPLCMWRSKKGQDPPKCHNLDCTQLNETDCYMEPHRFVCSWTNYCKNCINFGHLMTIAAVLFYILI